MIDHAGYQLLIRFSAYSRGGEQTRKQETEKKSEHNKKSRKAKKKAKKTGRRPL
jgi:hypothetical protein